MAAITKDTECFVKLPGDQKVFETTNFPGEKQVLQTFYGDYDGASEPHKDMVYLMGDSLGFAMGQIVVDQGVEYQLISCDVTVRKNSGLFSWGSGVYTKERRPIYAASSIISTDKVWADEVRYQRENKDKIAKELADKKKQELVDKLSEDSSTPQTGNTATSSGFNLTSIIVIVFAFLGLIIGGVLWWKGKQNKKSQGIQNANTPLNNTSNGSI